MAKTGRGHRVPAVRRAVRLRCRHGKRAKHPRKKIQWVKIHKQVDVGLQPKDTEDDPLTTAFDFFIGAR